MKMTPQGLGEQNCVRKPINVIRGHKGRVAKRRLLVKSTFKTLAARRRGMDTVGYVDAGVNSSNCWLSHRRTHRSGIVPSVLHWCKRKF